MTKDAASFHERLKLIFEALEYRLHAVEFSGTQFQLILTVMPIFTRRGTD